MATDRDQQAAHDAAHYPLLSDRKKDAIDRKWDNTLYFCPECDDAHRDEGDYHRCPDCPREHDDATAYVGTGTNYPESFRRLARLMATD